MTLAAHPPASALGTPHLLDLLGLVQDVLDADTATLLVLDPAEQVLDCIAALGNDEMLRRPFRVPVGRGFAGRVAHERAAVTVEQVDAGNVLNPAILRGGVQSLLGVPVLDGGRLLGVLHVGSHRLRVFSDQDKQLLTRSAARIAQALTSSPDDELAEHLQRLLLPDRPHDLPGLDVASRYVPAEGDLGGDWYDVFTLPTGEVGLVIGDVMGHGLASAVVMVRIRSALRAYALEHDDPGRVLDLLDSKVAAFEPDALATVVYAVTAPPFDRIRFASAGHPAPLMAEADGTVRQLDVAAAPPLGIGWDGARQTVQLPWPPEASLCLFTDGLVERRNRPDQLAGLSTLAATFGPEHPQVACDRILAAELADHTAVEDDIALLVARRTAAG